MPTQTTKVKWIILLLIIWAFCSMLFAYGKQWIGNKQELYPTFLYPAFLRHPYKTANYLYPYYYIEAMRDGQTERIEAKDFFHQHWVKKMELILKKEDFTPVPMSSLDNRWADRDSIILVKETKKYKDGVPPQLQESESIERKTYAVR
jgi:hypothetical protein